MCEHVLFNVHEKENRLFYVCWSTLHVHPCLYSHLSKPESQLMEGPTDPTYTRYTVYSLSVFAWPDLTSSTSSIDNLCVLKAQRAVRGVQAFAVVGYFHI